MTKQSEDQAAQHAEHAREIDDPDLVKRARKFDYDLTEAFDLCNQMADRIEQLEASLARRETMLKATEDRIEQLEADKKRQTKEIQDCREQLRRGQDILIERARRISALEFIVAKHQSQDLPESSESPSLNTLHGQE